MTKIKVLQLIDSLNVGGAEMLAVNIANALTVQNFESHLCTTRKEGELKENLKNDVKYIFLARKKVFDFKAIIKLRTYIKKNSINIIHAHSTSSFLAFCVKFSYPKVKIVWHDHFGNSEFLSRRKVYPLKNFSNYFEVIISVNKQLKKWAEDNLLTKKVVFLENFASFKNLTKKTTLKGEKGFRIVHVAGFRPQKDHINLLKAFQIVLKEHPNWTLHIIGKSYKDDYAASIFDFIKHNNLESNIFLYGVCADVKNILNQSDIGVLSSKSEGLPISLLEYGLAKLPVVITNVGECINVVGENCGIIVASENCTALANGISQMITSKEKRLVFGSNLNNQISECFSEELFITKIALIYKNLC